MVGEFDETLVHRMCQVLEHRGPDDKGVFSDCGGRAVLGMRRLSIIDLVNGHQPMSNEDGSLWIVFNGEIYNYRELREQLRAKGHRFRSQSDTEVIIHAFEQYGKDCVKHFDGMFAFAIWNKATKELFLARDRVGEKPLFYWYSKGSLLFASEIKAILQDTRVTRTIDFTGLYNLLGRRFTPGNRTIFADVLRLDPGSTLTYQNGSLKIDEYWRPNFSRKLYWSETRYRIELEERIRSSVRSRMIADVPVGVFLSGGMDSSAITAFASETRDRPVKTFSLGFAESEDTVFNELPFARVVAEAFATEHYEFVIQAADLLEQLPQIIWHFDEPFAGALPQYFLSNLASEHVKVALGGLGADELFGGYGRSGPLHARLGRLGRTYGRLPRRVRNRIVELLVGETTASRANHRWTRFVRDFVERSGNLGYQYANMDCPYTEEFKRTLLEESVLGELDEQRILPRILQSLFDEVDHSEFMDQMFYVDLKTQLVNEYLLYSDILSMANSLEIRSPYLSRELIDFVIRIPSKYRSKDDDPKSLLKKTVSKYVPAEVINRPKGGFSLPIGTWVRKELSNLVDELLSPERLKLRGYFRPEIVSRIVSEHRTFKANHAYKIWSLLVFELWHEIYVDDFSRTKADVRSLSVVT